MIDLTSNPNYSPFKLQMQRQGPALVLSVKAPRVQLACIETGETRPCILNPTTLDENITVNYDELKPLGSDHPVAQYKGTDAHEVPLELMFDKAIAANRLGKENPDIDGWRGFLLQFTGPLAVDKGYAGGAPPRFLLVWPNVLSIIATVRTLNFSYQRFSIQDLAILTYTATLSLREARQGVWTSERLRLAGGRRAGGADELSAEQPDTIMAVA